MARIWGSRPNGPTALPIALPTKKHSTSGLAFSRHPHTCPDPTTRLETSTMQADPGWRRNLRSAGSELSAKRRGASAPIDAWYPYYAGFSYKFAKRILAELPIPKGATVLDPWNGSGTTTAAALHVGHVPLGVDLNPSTIALARAKLATRNEVNELEARTKACIRDARRVLGSGHAAPSDPLRAWLPPRVAGLLRLAVSTCLARARSGSLADLDPKHCLVIAALLAAGRVLAVGSRTGPTNTTWVRPVGMRPRYARLSEFEDLAVLQAAHIALDRDLCPGSRPSGATCLVGDARALNVASGSIDAVLTSPPYCTRIDYAKQMGFEHCVLYDVRGQAFRILRDSLMGTTTIRQGASSFTGFPSSVRRLLGRIHDHPSHRSAAYYARNFAQYFSDAVASMEELARVLRPGGYGVFVLQNSYYKELEIPLSKCFRDIASSLGLGAEVVVQQPVLKSMTSVNTRARSYARDREYFEDVLLVEKTRHRQHQVIQSPSLKDRHARSRQPSDRL